MKTALITGASSGIGGSLCRELAARGWHVGMVARRIDVLEKNAEALRAKGASVSTHALDVRDAGRVKEEADRLVAERGSIELAIANAGIGFPTPAKKFPLDDAVAIFRTNVEGMLNLFAAVIPHMLERGEGRFVGVASMAGFRGMPGASVYSSSKAAMQSFLEASRIELIRTGVGVTTVNPGFVATPMTEKNRFTMPFLIGPDEAAKIIIEGIEAESREINFPLPMLLAIKVLRNLPASVYDRLALRMARSRRDPEKYRR